MQRTGASESYQCEITWIITLLYRYQPQCTTHVFVNDFYDTFGRGLEINTQSIGYFFYRRYCCVARYVHITAKPCI